MEQGDYFKMVESALSSLKSTRRSFHDIWCFIIMNYRIKADTKAYHNIQQALNTGVRDGLFQEYMCRGITRFKLNMDKRPIATKGHLKSVKVQSKTTQVKGKESDIKSPSSNNVPENRSNKRKKSGQTSPPKKKIKTQTVPSKSATAVVETQSVPRNLRMLYMGFTVKLPDDRWDCTVRGIDVTPDGRILVVDRRIKLFDKDGNILDTLKINLFNGPDKIAVISNDEAVCTVTPDSEIYIIDLKDNKLFIKDTIRVIPRSWVSDISVHGDQFIVANGTIPMSVQLIDRQGKVYWSRQRDAFGQQLLATYSRLTSFTEGGRLKIVIVAVSDNRLVKLDGETGEVLMVTQLFCSGIRTPAEITHDGENLIFVSNPVTGEIYSWNYGLTECNVILSDTKELRGKPSCIKYDAPNEQLLVSYGNHQTNVIDLYRPLRTS